MTWERIAISEVSNVVTGSTPKTKRADFFGGDIPFVTPAELEQATPIVSTPRTLSMTGAQQVRLVPPNAILVCCIGSLGKVGIAGRTLATNQQINAIVFDERKVWPRFGYYACRLLKPTLENMAPATTVAIVSKSKFQALEIPLPPIEEQKRIAAILDQADELRRKRQRALDRLNQLGQAIFIEMFGDPTTNPMGWSVTRLGEIVRAGDRINYGVVQPGDEVESGVPLIRVGDLLKPFIDPNLVKHIDPSIEVSYARSRLVGDEILIGCVGSIGTVALAHAGLKGANIARAVARVPIDNAKADRRFLAAMIRSPLVQRYFTAETRTVAQPTLNIGLIIDAPILLPPLDLQRQFSLTLDRIELIAEALFSGTVACDRLFTSLQYLAFGGALTASSLKEAAA